MSNIFQIFGKWFCIFGGIILATGILSAAFWSMSAVWIAINNNCRKIFKTESLIYEYKKNRNRFLEWMKQEEESNG